MITTKGTENKKNIKILLKINFFHSFIEYFLCFSHHDEISTDSVDLKLGDYKRYFGDPALAKSILGHSRRLLRLEVSSNEVLSRQERSLQRSHSR